MDKDFSTGNREELLLTLERIKTLLKKQSERILRLQARGKNSEFVDGNVEKRKQRGIRRKDERLSFGQTQSENSCKASMSRSTGDAKTAQRSLVRRKKDSSESQPRDGGFKNRNGCGGKKSEKEGIKDKTQKDAKDK